MHKRDGNEGCGLGKEYVQRKGNERICDCFKNQFVRVSS